MKRKGRKKGDVVKNWLDEHEWLIDHERARYFNNISFTARSLTKQLKNTEGDFVNFNTFRAQLSRWLTRRENLKKLAKAYNIDTDMDVVKLVEQIQYKQYNKKEPLNDSKAK